MKILASILTSQVLPGLGLALLLCAAQAGCGDDDTSAAREGTSAGECSDGADNDGDGAFDCVDPDCAGSSDCRPNTSDAGSDISCMEVCEHSGRLCPDGQSLGECLSACDQANLSQSRRRCALNARTCDEISGC